MVSENFFSRKILMVVVIKTTSFTAFSKSVNNICEPIPLEIKVNFPAEISQTGSILG